jgi:phosphoribosyl 1,2-cyclic phosphodiesterase
MPLSIASLNSGSNGNCYYIGNEEDAILIDAGISCRETERRMMQLGLSPKKIRAIFISHEHSDHIRGLPVLARKYQLPVYITPATHRSCGNLSAPGHLSIPFFALQPVCIGELEITAFPKFHDAADPHSFVIECSGTTVGVFTDIGNACANLTSYFKRCHAAFLEANYDDELLEKGRYPYFLKTRIRGGYGHLSNQQALELFQAHRPEFMTHLLLSHLSRDNNNPQLVSELFSNHANGVEIIVASREAASRVYRINGAFPPKTEEPAQGVLFG